VELRTLLEERWQEHELLRAAGRLVPWVFHRDGERIVSFHRAWRTACRAAGVPGRIPHDLRRTAVRNLVRAGVPETVAMKLTGHKTRSVFERYNIVSEGDLREAARKLDGATGLVLPGTHRSR
jgi:integrase